MLDQSIWRPSSRYCDISCFYILACEEALAIRRVFSLVDMITNTKFSNCTFVFKIGAVGLQNMHSKHENTFQTNLSLTKQLKFALSTPTPHFTSFYWVRFRPDFE